MMRSIFVIVSLYVCISFCNGDDHDKKLHLRVIKHQPCTSKPSRYEKIRFPSIEEAAITPGSEDGCYSISGGKVNVWKAIKGTVQIYADIKYGTKAPSENCRGADNQNCGGVGSCIYCHACSGFKNVASKAHAMVDLETGTGRKLDCDQGLNAGNYSNVRIKFCMPTKEDLLKSQNMDEQFWNQYVADGRLFFVVIYIFNDAVNQLSRTELSRIATTENDKVIGCHRLVGTISE